MTRSNSVRARARAGQTAVSKAPATNLDRIDRQILKRLQQDGRLPISQLAREVNLTVTPCFERVKQLEAAGYISGSHARLNPEPLGLGLLAYIAVNLNQTTPDVCERFTEAMLGFDEVLECQMVGGGFDYLVKVRVRDMNAFRRFLAERMAAVRGVQQTHTDF